MTEETILPKTTTYNRESELNHMSRGVHVQKILTGKKQEQQGTLFH